VSAPINFEIRLADLTDPRDAAAIAGLLDHYAAHPFGNEGPLPDDVRERFVDGLREHPTTHVFLSESSSKVVGMAICFLGFSTFKAKPLINIHDLIVLEAFRGQGIGGALIDCIVATARDNDWCAVTLEVRADNPARELYARKGFHGLSPNHDQHTTLFGKLPL
jgi:ribosomal protein S18 acetylase RimI-like enzyme